MMYKHFSVHALKGAFIFFLYLPTFLVGYLAFTTDYIPSTEFAGIRFVVLLLFAPMLIKYAIQLFVSPFFPVIESMRDRKRSKSFVPSVSVCIPAWNEEVGIRSTISSVIATEYPDLEIIVANDGSTDGTHEAVTTFIREWQESAPHSRTRIHYLKLQNGGKARAMNAALAIAQGEIILTIDADCVMDPHMIARAVKHFTDPRVASVAGNVVIGNRKQAIGLVQQLEYLYGFYFKRADSLLNSVYIVGGAAAAYRKNILLEVGGFNEHIITEDIEMSTRLQDRGYHIRYAPDAVVYTEGPSDLKSLCRQRLRWKFGRFHTFYIYRNLFFSLDKRHSRYLCFLVLPIALFSEAMLFFEGVMLTIFYTYTFYTNDYMPLFLVIVFLTSIICLQILSDSKRSYHKNLLFLAPGAWLLFYYLDVVEYQALIKSLWSFVTKKHPSWQKWTRLGVFEDGLKKT